MPPVLAVVAAVATVGSVVAPLVGGAILGISAATFGLIALGASVGSSLLRGGRKAPEPSRENVNRLRANIDVRAPRKTVIGTTAMATDIRDEEFTGTNQDYFHRFIVCASHKVNAISEIWFDDKQAWTLAGGVQGEFVGYLDVAVVLEGNSGNAINISARMGTTRRFTGCAYVHLKYKLTGNDSKVDSPFAQSVTTRITIIGNGALVYDPRLDSTVAGGSGSHRADNQATWAWSTGACHNPALALLFYLLGWEIGGKLAVGKGIPKDRIDLESFAVAANICDESVTKVGGGTEPRYRVAGVWSEGDSPNTVIDMLKACMNADLDDVDGKLRLTIFTDDGFSSDADFTDDDILNAFEWQASRPLDQSFNVVRGVHTDASTTSLYQQVDYPQVAATSPDGIDRIMTLDLPMVESVSQAQRLAQLRLTREEFSGTFKADFQATAWRVEKNSIVRLTFAPLGFVNKTFRVAEMELRVDGVVPLTLVEEDPDIYVAPALQYGVDGVGTTPYDPLLNPIIDALTAPVIRLAATTQIITYDAYGVLEPTTQDNLFEIARINATATCNWTLEDLLGNTLTAATYLSATSGDSVTMTAADFSAAIAVNGAMGLRIIATVIEPSITLVETINVYKLQDNSGVLVGFLTNPDVSLSATSAGVVSSFATASGTFKMFLGTDDVTTSSTFAEVTETNCTGTVNATTGAYSVTALSADNGSYTMTGTYGAYPVITQVFTLSKSKAGSNGSPGTNGTRTALLYMYRWSSTTPTTWPSGSVTYTWATGQFTDPGTLNSWSRTIPAHPGGTQILWRIVQIFTDTDTSATDTVTWTGSYTPEQYTPTIGDLALLNTIATVKIDANAVTKLTSAYTAGNATLTANTFTEVQAITFTATGEPVKVTFGMNLFYTDADYTNALCHIRVRKNGSDWAGPFVIPGPEVNGGPDLGFMFMGSLCLTDTPSAGSTTYSLQVKAYMSGSGYYYTLYDRYLEALETKR
jgi:hypothetical protein